ncbi:MAG: PadR family transcriptional regulator [Clostridia bacterium]|nr:PadR family transcriptional regulator [Clostridia bacterium]
MNIKNHSPLTEASYYILLSLVKPLHGYGIIKTVEEMSNHRIKLAAGTLYGALSTLLNYRLIKIVNEQETSRKRKTYYITYSGMELLKYEIERLEEMIQNGKNSVEEYHGD